MVDTHLRVRCYGISIEKTSKHIYFFLASSQSKKTLPKRIDGNIGYESKKSPLDLPKRKTPVNEPFSGQYLPVLGCQKDGLGYLSIL